ncbi:hypothetical protein P4S72_00335 [Vibrio sp. PP-XX7]
MSDVLVTLNRLAPKGSEVILISDYTRYDDQFKPLFNQLRQHNVVRLIHIYDPLWNKERPLFRGNRMRWRDVFIRPAGLIFPAKKYSQGKKSL